MDAKRAAEVLNGWDKAWSDKDARGAANLGADALKAWAWVERHKAVYEPCGRSWQVYGPGVGYGEGATPLLAVLDAMEREGKG